jgi:hypothetical protein
MILGFVRFLMDFRPCSIRETGQGLAEPDILSDLDSRRTPVLSS